MSMEKMLKTGEVAEALRTTEETVREWIKKGRFPNAIRPGRSYLIPESDVTNMLEEAYGEIKE